MALRAWMEWPKVIIIDSSSAARAMERTGLDGTVRFRSSVQPFVFSHFYPTSSSFAYSSFVFLSHSFLISRVPSFPLLLHFLSEPFYHTSPSSSSSILPISSLLAHLLFFLLRLFFLPSSSSLPLPHIFILPWSPFYPPPPPPSFIASASYLYSTLFSASSLFLFFS